jgi:2-polyprenyl-3-methyl-5-hydroxy-6-metoxy-1,4-benzoquinol methylase
MKCDRLSRHYDEKYARQCELRSRVTPHALSMPSNRFEAAVSFCGQAFKGGSILEIGAGDGCIASGLLQAGVPFAHYRATEASAVRLQSLRQRLDDSRFSITPFDVESRDEKVDEKYDMIIMVAVIEHLIDPISAMTRLRACLNPGGVIYIDTPNIAKLTRRLKLLGGRFPATASKDEGLMTYAGGPVDLFDEGHLHYFTYRSLMSMLTRACGFSRVTTLGYACAPFLFPRWIHHVLARACPRLFSEIAILAQN